MEEIVKIHHLRPAQGAKKAKTRVGRGDGSKGKTAGRGTKGTKARNTVNKGFEGGQMPIHMRLPKLHGFKNPSKITYQVVNLDSIQEAFPKGGEVSSTELAINGLVRANQPVKILGSGQVSAKFTLKANKISKTAIEKIEKAGGKFEKI